MPEEMIKTIIVDNQETHEFLSNNFPNWDTQHPVTNLTELWDGLQGGTLAQESEVIFISDELYAQNEDLFVATLATLSPYALIIVASWDPGITGVIEERLGVYRKKKDLPKARIYWIEPNVAISQIEESVFAYEDNKNNPIIDVPEPVAPVVSQHSSNVDTDHNGVVVTVTSSKGGSGKSTVASLLAAQIAKSSEKATQEGKMERPLKVCLVDLDIFDGQLGFLLGFTKPTSLNIALSKDIFGPELIYNNLVYSSRMGFHALLAPIRGTTAMHTGPDFYGKVINLLRTMFDVIILDTSVQYYDDLIKRVALPDSDVILLVTTLDIKSISGMSRWINTARTGKSQGGHDVNMKKVGIVVNQSSDSVSMDEDKLISAAAGVPLLVAIPLDTIAVQAAGNNNRLENVIEAHPQLGAAYFSLARKLTKNIGIGVDINLSPLIDDQGIHATRPAQAASNRAPQAIVQPKPARSGWFTKK